MLTHAQQGGARRRRVTKGATAGGRGFALSDAKVLADGVGTGVEDLVHVAEGVRVVEQARLRGSPCCVRHEDFEGAAACMPADAPVSLAPERVIETGSQ